jgi:hypothetical protein
MPIKTLQQQQAQVGRIRIGQQVPTAKGKARPAKLDRFRFTTPSRQLAEAVAAQYGGEVAEWKPDGHAAEFEVVSTATTLPVLVPPNPVSQWYEMWSGAGCVRRCDGETETISGEACKCPLDHLERGDLAGQGKACKATTRLKVMLPELPGIGVWRLDTHGYYAAIELPQTADFLGAVTDAGGYIRATLALEERIVKRPGVGIRSFLVPALHVDVTPEALMGGAGTALPGRATAAIAAGGIQQPVREQTALPPGSSEAEAQAAQAIADQAMQATTREQIQALWTSCNGEVKLLHVSDGNGVVGPLGDLLQARGKELPPAQQTAPQQPAETAPAAPPAAENIDDLTEDELWVEIVSAAAAFPDSFDVDSDFQEWSGGTQSGAASIEQLRNYLRRLQEPADEAVPA